MSTWGPGNFENDSASDFLSQLVRDMFRVVAEHLTPVTVNSGEFLELHGESKVIPAIAIFIALHGQLKMSPGVFRNADTGEWKRLYLQGWNNEIDDYYHHEDPLRIERRKVIEQTFDELIDIVAKERNLYEPP